jgi:hypothetical protein
MEINPEWRPRCFIYSRPEIRLKGCYNCPWLEECGYVIVENKLSEYVLNESRTSIKDEPENQVKGE